MKIPTRFIVIDDDLLNNMLCRVIIKRAAGESDIQTFNIPEVGFEYISTEYSNGGAPTVLFLDINMPTWSGWEFLDNFEKLDDKIKKQIKIYMLSSSLDTIDKQKASDNKYVVDYIVKPFSEKRMLEILDEQKQMV